MSFNESPSLKEYEQGIPRNQKDPAKKKKFIRILIAVLAVISISLWIWAMSDSGAINVLLSNGTIKGRVVSEDGSPLKGEVFVLGMEKEVFTDNDGYFEIGGVPSGYQTFIVAHNGAAEEYPVQVQPGEVSDLGEIRFIIVTPAPSDQ
ncbi:MAG: carboxypeptidase-like regulatory domain-containing protein [Anaerolineales bacterium]|nr:carboxypeptidase-like regulatory domain-containing protein [Anaerolineales bacterium]